MLKTAAIAMLCLFMGAAQARAQDPAPLPAKPTIDEQLQARGVYIPYKGGTPKVTEGLLELNQTFLSVPLNYGLTGVLNNDVGTKAGWTAWSTATIPAGTPVYGVPFAGAYGSQNDWTWCAPRAVILKATGKKKWEAVCFYEAIRGMFGWMGSDHGLAVTVLGSNSVGRVNKPEVIRQPVDFGVNPRIEYRFSNWRLGGMNLSIHVVTDDTDEMIAYARLPEKRANFSTMGGVFNFQVTGKQATMSVIKPPITGLPLNLGDPK